MPRLKKNSEDWSEFSANCFSYSARGESAAEGGGAEAVGAELVGGGVGVPEFSAPAGEESRENPKMARKSRGIPCAPSHLRRKLEKYLANLTARIVLLFSREEKGAKNGFSNGSS